MLEIIILCIILLLFIRKTLFIRKAKFVPMPIHIVDKNDNGPTIGIIAGVHGNEQSGTIALNMLIKSGYFNRITKGKIKIVLCANPCGYNIGIRQRCDGSDLNRKFKNPQKDKDAKIIIENVENCDLTIDFHEAWGWNSINSNSLGSTITPTTKTAEIISLRVIDNLNSIIKDEKKNYKLGNIDIIPCDIKSTLSCYMQTMGYNHILVEIPGQKNIQSIEERCRQIFIVVDTILKFYDMIKD